MVFSWHCEEWLGVVMVDGFGRRGNWVADLTIRNFSRFEDRRTLTIAMC